MLEKNKETRVRVNTRKHGARRQAGFNIRLEWAVSSGQSQHIAVKTPGILKGFSTDHLWLDFIHGGSVASMFVRTVFHCICCQEETPCESCLMYLYRLFRSCGLNVQMNERWGEKEERKCSYSIHFIPLPMENSTVRSLAMITYFHYIWVIESQCISEVSPEGINRQNNRGNELRTPGHAQESTENRTGARTRRESKQLHVCM